MLLLLGSGGMLGRLGGCGGALFGGAIVAGEGEVLDVLDLGL